MPEPSQKRKRLTPKQARFVSALPTAKSNAEAARIAGYAASRSRTTASELLDTPHVQAAVDAAFKKAGISLDLMAKKLREGMDANEIKFFAHEGVVCDKRVTTDFPTRHRYLETGLELSGALGRRKQDAAPASNVTVFAIIQREAAARGLPL